MLCYIFRHHDSKVHRLWIDKNSWSASVAPPFKDCGTFWIVLESTTGGAVFTD